jgi:hypothetical protein
MPRTQADPSTTRVTEGAPGAVADLVKQEPRSTWDDIVRRHPAVAPRWVDKPDDQTETASKG